MTDHGLAFVIYRLCACDSLEGLRRVWDSLSDEYKRAPEVRAIKDRMKERLQ